MKTRQRNQRLSEIAVELAFRIIDGVSIRSVESDPGDSDACCSVRGPRACSPMNPPWARLAETTHLVAIDLPGFGTGVTPAEFAERARADAARLKLEQTTLQIDCIARACRFRYRRAYAAHFSAAL
jgi:hypothetical protein